MKSLFSYKNGHLKTGRVAILVFIMLLICLGLLFKARKPVDQVLVKVSHVFDAENQIEPPPRIEAVNEPDEVEEAKRRTTKKTSPQQGEPFKKKIEDKNAGDLTGNNKDDVKKEEAVIPEKLISDKSLASLKEKNKTSSLEVNKEEIKWPQIPFDEESKQEKHDLNQLDVSRQLASYSNTDPTKTKQEPIQLHSGFAGNISLNKSKSQTDKIEMGHAEYMDVMQSWNTSGKTANEKTTTIPLRVENLKSSYNLLQMKPVAVVNGSQYIDLTDGSRLSIEVLKNYSSTVFLVDDPWGKWGKELNKSHINKNKKLEVRYYMYGFIRNAIYQRVQQAFNWSKQSGLLDSATSESDVDVLGRTFVISRQGGGRFGVFVPLEIGTNTGPKVTIDLTIFNDQPDIQALLVAGIL
jgi:hypothetical protein